MIRGKENGKMGRRGVLEVLPLDLELGEEDELAAALAARAGHRSATSATRTLIY